MPMREDCRHFQSRTYDDGEVARLCTLDLAPEAPWRCPDDCPRYERDSMAVGFTAGSLKPPPVEPEPDEAPEDIAAVLQEADAIVTEVGPEVLAEVEAQRQGKRWWQFWRRRPDDRDDGGDGEIRLSNR